VPEKLLDVQVKIAKAVFADTVKHAKTVVAAKDVQELTEIQTTSVQPSTEKAAAYGRSIYSVVAETQAELSKFFEVRFADANKNLTSATRQGCKKRPRWFRCSRRRSQVRTGRCQPSLRRIQQGDQASNRSHRSNDERRNVYTQEKGRVSDQPSRSSSKAPRVSGGPLFLNPAIL
jgi:phasin family protein